MFSLGRPYCIFKTTRYVSYPTVLCSRKFSIANALSHSDTHLSQGNNAHVRNWPGSIDPCDNVAMPVAMLIYEEHVKRTNGICISVT